VPLGPACQPVLPLGTVATAHRLAPFPLPCSAAVGRDPPLSLPHSRPSPAVWHHPAGRPLPRCADLKLPPPPPRPPSFSPFSLLFLGHTGPHHAAARHSSVSAPLEPPVSSINRHFLTPVSPSSCRTSPHSSTIAGAALHRNASVPSQPLRPVVYAATRVSTSRGR
jgi:hypothetical protein